MTENITAARAGKIPVSMVREVHDSRLVRGRGIVDAESVGVVQRERNGGVELSRITFVAVGAGVAEFHADRIRRGHWLGLPEHAIKALAAAVQVVGAIVRRECISLAVESELAASDA